MDEIEQEMFKWDLQYLIDQHEISINFSSEEGDKKFEDLERRFIEKWSKS